MENATSEIEAKPSDRGGGRERGRGREDGSWKAPFRFFRMHWDHEPGRARCPHRAADQTTVCDVRGGLRTARPTLRFMESPLSFFRMHWDDEPASGPLSPSLSPPQGGGGGRPRGRK